MSSHGLYEACPPLATISYVISAPVQAGSDWLRRRRGSCSTAVMEADERGAGAAVGPGGVRPTGGQWTYVGAICSPGTGAASAPASTASAPACSTAFSPAIGTPTRLPYAVVVAKGGRHRPRVPPAASAHPPCLLGGAGPPLGTIAVKTTRGDSSSSSSG